jgi:hypothetical protein
LLKPLRAFVTVKDPSSRAATLIQNAGPLCAGGGVAPAPGAGAAPGSIGSDAGCSSTPLAMKAPGTVRMLKRSPGFTTVCFDFA